MEQLLHEFDIAEPCIDGFDCLAVEHDLMVLDMFETAVCDEAANPFQFSRFTPDTVIAAYIDNDA